MPRRKTMTGTQFTANLVLANTTIDGKTTLTNEAIALVNKAIAGKPRMSSNDLDALSKLREQL